MQKTLLDTDILSLLLRQHTEVIQRASVYLETFPYYSFSLITRYEILRGLKTKNAQKQLRAFAAFCDASEILPINENHFSRISDLKIDNWTQSSIAP